MWTWQSVIKGFAVGIACRVAIKVLNYIADLGVILVAVPFGILSCLPEAQSQDASRVRHEHNFIHKTCLRLQRRQHLLMQHAANFSGISWLRLHFDNANEHGKDSFQFNMKSTNRREQAYGWKRN